MCSGRHCRPRDRERMQGDTEPGKSVCANEGRGRVYLAKQRAGPERQTSSKRRWPRGAFSLEQSIRNSPAAAAKVTATRQFSRRLRHDVSRVSFQDPAWW